MNKNLDSTQIPKTLEVGSGSGQATSRLIEISEHLDCIEPGDNFVSILRKKYAPNQNVNIIKTLFEDYKTDNKYNLITFATALHWIFREYAYLRIPMLLKPKGWLLSIWSFPKFAPQVYSVIEETIGHEIPGFYIPGWNKQEINYFENGFNDFVNNRNFANCQKKVYSTSIAITAKDLALLIWSDVNDIHLSNDVRKRLFNSLYEKINHLNINKHYITHDFPVVMGEVVA